MHLCGNGQCDGCEIITLIYTFNAIIHLKPSFPSHVEGCWLQPGQKSKSAFSTILLFTLKAPVAHDLPKPSCLCQHCRFVFVLAQKGNQLSAMWSPKIASGGVQAQQSPQQTVSGAIAKAPVPLIVKNQAANALGQTGNLSKGQGSSQLSCLGTVLFLPLPLPFPLGLPWDGVVIAWRAVASGDCPMV